MAAVPLTDRVVIVCAGLLNAVVTYEMGKMAELLLEPVFAALVIPEGSAVGLAFPEALLPLLDPLDPVPKKIGELESLEALIPVLTGEFEEVAAPVSIGP